MSNPLYSLTPREYGEREPIIRRRMRQSEPWKRDSNWRWVLAAGLILLCVLAVVVAAGVMGYYDGLKDREESRRIQALEHYRAGIAHMASEEYELAEAEFEEAIRLQPALTQAWTRLRETQARLATVPTPTSVPLPPTSVPIALAEDPAAKATLLNEARGLYERGAYSEAISRIEKLLQADPRYEPAQVEELLFNCYAKLGAALVDQDRLEEAVRYFDQALKLRPNAALIKTERDLAAGYITAIGYWDADWESAIRALTGLYKLRPAYKDVSIRLYRAQVEYADLLRERGEWCDASEWYAKALQVYNDPGVGVLRDQMRANCADHVPPPTMNATPATGTPGVTVTVTGTTTATVPAPVDISPAALRELGGRGVLYFAIRDEVKRQYVLNRINADGTGLSAVTIGMHQPQVSHSGTLLVARARSNVKTLGLYLIDLTAGDTPAIHQVTSHVDDLYPSFSSDDGQVAFASNRMSARLWSIFTAPADGKSEPKAFVQGHTPHWGPANLIVYKGCDDSGNQCGIYVVHTSGADKQRIVADPSAILPVWSPDGKQLAFMSNREGNWDVYLVGADGRGLRRLTQSTGSEGLPAWSPDGKMIAYLSDRDGKWGIYLHRLEDGKIAKLVTIDSPYEDWMMERIAWGPALR